MKTERPEEQAENCGYALYKKEGPGAVQSVRIPAGAHFLLPQTHRWQVEQYSHLDLSACYKKQFPCNMTMKLTG
jgi:hypothetical protein